MVGESSMMTTRVCLCAVSIQRKTQGYLKEAIEIVKPLEPPIFMVA